MYKEAFRRADPCPRRRTKCRKERFQRAGWNFFPGKPELSVCYNIHTHTISVCPGTAYSCPPVPSFTLSCLESVNWCSA